MKRPIPGLVTGLVLNFSSAVDTNISAAILQMKEESAFY